MCNTNNYQFIIDEIPDKDLDRFLRIMRSFSMKTQCRFQYKEGKGVRNHLIPVPLSPRSKGSCNEKKT